MRGRDFGAIADYTSQALGTPLLSSAEELVVTREVRREAASLAAGRIGPGERPARDWLYRANLRLVVGVAHRFVDRGVDLEDLVQEGNCCLAHAVDAYDPDHPNPKTPGKPIRFSTYATWAIRKGLARMTQMMRRRAMVTCVDISDVLEVFDAADEWEDPAEASWTLAELMDALSARERAVLAMRHGLDGIPGGARKLREVAVAFKVSKQRIQQIEDVAIHKMAVLAGQPRQRPVRAFCDHGHEMSPENTYVSPSTGHVRCRECRRRMNRDYEERSRRKKQAV